MVHHTPQLDHPIVCALLVADVIVHEGLGIVEEDEPREVSYEALSYTWDAPVFSRPVKINSLEIFVTDNLDSALRYLRLTDSKRYLWVDALCINQFDFKEKSIQVGRMFSIYKKAHRVVAWNPGWTPKKSAILSTVLMNISNDQKHSEGCIERFKDLHDFLMNACEPPLFKRTWVRQEGFAARELVMQFNDLLIPWEDYERIRDFIALIGGRADDHKSRNGRNRAARYEPVSLIDALVFSSHFGVTDARDLVYGILGFTITPISQGLPDVQRPSLKVDYSRSISKVYQDVVRYEIERTKSLGILDFAVSRPATSDLPSWTPDWRTYDPRIAQHRVLNRTNSWKYGFIDVQRIGVSWKPVPQPHETDGILHCRGVILGTLLENVDETTAWEPFISDSFDSGFKKRFGGRCFDDVELFPGAKRDYRSTFNDMFKDGNIPLHEGRLGGVSVSKAGEQLLSILQDGMLEKIRFGFRDRIVSPPEPIRGNHIIGLGPRGICLASGNFVKGDIIVLFQGSPFPFVLRNSKQGRYTLIGRAIFPFLFEHKSASFDDFRMDERAWSSNSAVYTETTDILQSRFIWPEKMASIWKPVIQDADFLESLEDFLLV
ncbi:heterokaryon incompatibility protein-domain-containing protein [Hypomontagnella submonticulosa]|nr:heterokaryon incompatibility protein-domain-containing protein [Hypomontagnella submonticulosa]